MPCNRLVLVYIIWLKSHQTTKWKSSSISCLRNGSSSRHWTAHSECFFIVGIHLQKILQIKLCAFEGTFMLHRLFHRNITCNWLFFRELIYIELVSKFDGVRTLLITIPYEFISRKRVVERCLKYLIIHIWLNILVNLFHIHVLW